MSTQRESTDRIAHYIDQGYDLEAARRLAEFDQEYIKTLTPSEAEEYLALRKRIK